MEAALRKSRSRHGSLKGRPPSPDSAYEHDPQGSDLSEEGNPEKCAGEGRIMGTFRRRDLGTKGGADSDVDSGIVSCRKVGERIGSTSSADTDSSQESRTKTDYSTSIKSESTRSHHNSLRVPRRGSYLTQKVKGDHTALKECNRRPPTPLTVFPDPHHCVRFDEQLQLSEQNIRRSCRKLFATLYAQRFSYPNHPRSKENLDTRRSVCCTKSSSDACFGGKVILSPYTQRYKSQSPSRYPMDCADDLMSHATSTDSGLGSLRNSTQCTCHTQLLPSQTPILQCTCKCCCSCLQPENSPPKLFKSNSCSTLPCVLSHQSRPQLTQFPPRTVQRKASTTTEDRKSSPTTLQKTSSCSSLLNTNFSVADFPVYSDNMIEVYARIASVVPEDVKMGNSQGGRRARGQGRLRHTTDNALVDAYPPSLSETGPRTRSSLGHHTYNSPEVAETKSLHSIDGYSHKSESRSDFERKPVRDSQTSFRNRQRTIGVVIPNIGSNPVYLKSALKKPTQSAILSVMDPECETSVKCLQNEAEYAVVDKSKKNRFTSLPTLIHCTTPTDDKNPPVPPKKMLHKSDYSLNRCRSTSPRKSLLERVQTITKNARSALHKAFSTERIYRPEREERMEGERTLQRSKSFIKGLTASFRRKKHKKANREITPPVIITQASPSPEWDEHPNSVRGQLLQLNVDGSQVVELTKPPSKPYGFFVARGRVRNSKGVFVSRMRDENTQKQLCGLLDIGDEILEIDGYPVKDADILEVNNLMANKNTLLLTVLPYICRKDI